MLEPITNPQNPETPPEGTPPVVSPPQGAAPPAPGTPSAPAPTPTDENIVIPRSAFDARIAQKARAYLREELGTDDLGSVKKDLDEGKKARQAQMTEAERIKAENDELKKKSDEAEARAAEAQFRSDVTLAAIAAGVHPKNVELIEAKLARDINNGKYSDEELSALDYGKVIEEYRKDHPELFGHAQTPNGGAPPAPTPPAHPRQETVSEGGAWDLSDEEWRNRQMSAG